MTARISVAGELRVHGREVEILVRPRWTDADLEAVAALADFPARITIEPERPTQQAWGPVEVERARRRILDSLPNYRHLGFQPSLSDVMTDAMDEILKLIEEARR